MSTVERFSVPSLFSLAPCLSPMPNSHFCLRCAVLWGREINHPTHPNSLRMLQGSTQSCSTNKAQAELTEWRQSKSHADLQKTVPGIWAGWSPSNFPGNLPGFPSDLFWLVLLLVVCDAQPRGKTSSQDLQVPQNYKGKRNFILTKPQQYLYTYIRRNRLQMLLKAPIVFWISVVFQCLTALFQDYKILSLKPSPHHQF